MTRKLAPIHPGEILIEDFLKPLGVTQYRIAKAIRVPQRRISEIVQGKRGISADTALRFGRFFGMEAEFWINLQAHHDLEVARDALDAKLKRDVTPLTRAA